MSPRDIGPGDISSPVELEPAVCPCCGGSSVDEERAARADVRGEMRGVGEPQCDACEGTGYASPADYWAACAAELGDL